MTTTISSFHWKGAQERKTRHHVIPFNITITVTICWCPKVRCHKSTLVVIRQISWLAGSRLVTALLFMFRHSLMHNAAIRNKKNCKTSHSKCKSFNNEKYNYVLQATIATSVFKTVYLVESGNVLSRHDYYYYQLFGSRVQAPTQFENRQIKAQHDVAWHSNVSCTYIVISTPRTRKLTVLDPCKNSADLAKKIRETENIPACAARSPN